MVYQQRCLHEKSDWGGKIDGYFGTLLTTYASITFNIVWRTIAVGFDVEIRRCFGNNIPVTRRRPAYAHRSVSQPRAYGLYGYGGYRPIAYAVRRCCPFKNINMGLVSHYYSCIVEQCYKMNN